jgi:hypothetical protein
MQTHRADVKAAKRKFGHGSDDSEDEADAVDGRRKRAHTRGQAKAKKEHEDGKKAKKKVKVEAEADMLKSVVMMSPFVCHTPALEEQQLIKWAIEWTEHQTLSKLAATFPDATKRSEILDFLKKPMKQKVLLAYFGVPLSTFHKYLKKYRNILEQMIGLQSLSHQWFDSNKKLDRQPIMQRQLNSTLPISLIKAPP